MPNVTLTVETLIKMKSTETISCKKFDKLKAAGEVKSNEMLKKDLIEFIKSEVGADEVEVLELNTAIHDERVGNNA